MRGDQTIADAALAVRNQTIASPTGARLVAALEQRIELLEPFVRRYEWIDDPQIDTDDEVINWTFPDVVNDLRAAAWELECGFYKAGASSVRNAFDLAFVALYFQVRLNSDGRPIYPDSAFGQWDAGCRTPNWSDAVKSAVSKRPMFEEFDRTNGCELMSVCHEFFHALCNFTHSRAFDSTDPAKRVPTNSMGMGVVGPRFDLDVLERITNLALEAISWMATLWLVSFPGMIHIAPVGSLDSTEGLDPLLSSNSLGLKAIAFARSH
jgi:hypothetical protein